LVEQIGKVEVEGRTGVPEPAPVTIAVLPLTLYGAGRVVFDCFAAMFVSRFYDSHFKSTFKVDQMV
jgi:hypothetical protein